MNEQYLSNAKDLVYELLDKWQRCINEFRSIVQEHENNMICCPEDCYCWDARDLINSYEEWLNEN